MKNVAVVEPGDNPSDPADWWRRGEAPPEYQPEEPAFTTRRIPIINAPRALTVATVAALN